MPAIYIFKGLSRFRLRLLRAPKAKKRKVSFEFWPLGRTLSVILGANYPDVLMSKKEVWRFSPPKRTDDLCKEI
jgi:hypothetical protein